MLDCLCPLGWLLFVLVLNIPLAAAAAASSRANSCALLGVALDSPRARRWVTAEHSQRRMAAGDGVTEASSGWPRHFAAFGLADDCWQPALWRCDPRVCASARYVRLFVSVCVSRDEHATLVS